MARSDNHTAPDRSTTFKTGFLLYLSLCALRVVNSLLIQTQFDPDEYWQCLEPAYCEAFPERPCAYTWEWTRRASCTTTENWWQQSMEGPLRSYLSILPTYLFYELARLLQWDSWTYVIPRGPLVVNAILVAAPTDLAIWYIGHWMGTEKNASILPYWCLWCSVTSWFQGYALIRTYSNSVEAVLLTVGVALVSPELFGKAKRPHSNLRVGIAFVLGGMSVAIRFTSLAAWIPIGILLALNETLLINRLGYLLHPCALFGLIGIGISLIVDRFFYGFWTIPLLGSLHFNVIQGMGSLYGTHAAHWYVSVGIPAITGTMLPFVLYDFWTLLRHRSKSSICQRNVWIIIATYTLLHSASAHKEFRFLLPILPLLCVRAGYVMNEMKQLSTWRWLLCCILVLPNLVAWIFLGTVHQGAPIRINERIRQFASAGRQVQYTVHYLMGCHSTPLYSHLHVSSTPIQAWTLDCSPDCRSSSDRICESNQFAQDPAAFLQQVYIVEDESCALADPKECEVQKSVPDLLAVLASDAAKASSQLSALGLHEVDRFAHSVVGVNIGSLHVGDGVGRHVKFGPVEAILDDMILFAKPGLV